MTKKNLLGANCGKYFPRQGKESCRLQVTGVFMPWGFFYFYTRVEATNGSFIQTNKKKKKIRENYYSEVTLVLLHYSEHIEDTHFLWTLSHRPFPSIPDWTGSNCYAQPNWHCRFLEPFWVCVVKGSMPDQRESVSHRSTCKFLFPFCILLLLNIKTNRTYASTKWINWRRTFNILT